MKNFLIAKTLGMTTQMSALTNGQLGIYNLETGVPVPGAPTKSGLVVLGRTEGNIVLPIYRNKVSYVVSDYVAATRFTQTVTIPTTVAIGDYTLIVAKKGVGFNERNKWTANVHVYETGTTAAQVATKLAAEINANSASSGVTASASSAVVTVTAVEAGVDYKLVAADFLAGATMSTPTQGKAAQNDAKAIKDMFAKAAADLGFNDTQQFTELLYKGYDIDPLKGSAATDYGFKVVTIKFAEPRESRTTDTDVNQVIQIALPYTSSGAPTITSLTAILDTMCGKTASAS